MGWPELDMEEEKYTTDEGRGDAATHIHTFSQVKGDARK
jgi:hypothetical protein